MSSRAAWRLESLGFPQVYRYAAGKLDWFAYSLPMEGEFAAIPKAGDIVRRDVPACRLGDELGEVYERCQAVGWKVCLVVSESNVVLGRLRRGAWDADPDTPVENVMEMGPRLSVRIIFWNHSSNACMRRRWELSSSPIRMECSSDSCTARMARNDCSEISQRASAPSESAHVSAV